MSSEESYQLFFKFQISFFDWELSFLPFTHSEFHMIQMNLTKWLWALQEPKLICIYLEWIFSNHLLSLWLEIILNLIICKEGVEGIRIIIVSVENFIISGLILVLTTTSKPHIVASLFILMVICLSWLIRHVIFKLATSRFFQLREILSQRRGGRVSLMKKPLVLKGLKWLLVRERRKPFALLILKSLRRPDSLLRDLS